MPVEIGQIYRSTKDENPFFAPYLVEVLDIKRSTNGEQWIKYAFLHEDINNHWMRGSMEFTLQMDIFQNIYGLHNGCVLHNVSLEFKKQEEQIHPVINNAISQLEV